MRASQTAQAHEVIPQTLKAFFAIVIMGLLSVHAAFAASTPKVETYLAAVGATLPEFVRDALKGMKGNDLRMLAITIYLRAESSLANRWSWSQAQIDEYKNSSEHSEA